MRGNIKSSEFIKFDLWVSENTQIELKCSYSFKAQHPANADDKVLAIIVFFDADSKDDIVHLRAQCRVIFDFTDKDKLPNEDEFIEDNYIAAYQEFCKKANEALIVLGRNCFDFQDI